MTCLDCRAARHWSRSSGLSRWRSWFRLCWTHWQRRHARLHIAGQLALAGIATAFIIVMCGVAWQMIRLAVTP